MRSPTEAAHRHAVSRKALPAGHFQSGPKLTGVLRCSGYGIAGLGLAVRPEPATQRAIWELPQGEEEDPSGQYGALIPANHP